MTESLAAALRAFRYPADTSRILWADAIYIEQSDLAERSKQVSMMGELHSSAMRVLVWSGPATLGDEKPILIVTMAMQFIKALYAEFFKDEDRPKPHSLDEVCSVKQLIAYFTEDGHDIITPSLRLVFSRPYWERIWCVQEIYFARELDI